MKPTYLLYLLAFSLLSGGFSSTTMVHRKTTRTAVNLAIKTDSVKTTSLSSFPEKQKMAPAARSGKKQGLYKITYLTTMATAHNF